jgi:hypothetical protein
MNAVTTPGQLERWRTKREVAEHYGYSIRWVELMVARGMPSTLIGGQRRFRLSETDRWFGVDVGEGV